MNKKIIIFCVFFLLVFTCSLLAGKNFETDTITTSQGELLITFIGHGTLMFEFQNKIIHVDPVSREADYKNMPRADLVLITHEHGDHLDLDVLKMICDESTKIIISESCQKRGAEGIVMHNGETIEMCGLTIQAVPAYNIVHKRKSGEPYHPKEVGNGYVVDFADKKVYIAGDTENIPEMDNLENIDIAFLPMNLPYTMSPEMVADAAEKFNPHILYPYHFGNTDTDELVKLLEDNKEIEVRIRDMQ
ncbi:MAG: MBL fold metallo-hydrolase [bacterium]